jgi:hypothetical protein
MRVMHPTLLVGPADWDAAQLPREEYDARIAAFWRAADPSLAGIVVYGSPRDHAELAYLTHFTPKLEPAIALVPRRGEPRLLVGGGANMIGAAKPLTFVETLLPLRDAGQTIARWARELGSGGVALINGGAMRFGLRQEIEAALGAPPADVTGIVTAAMRRKSAREMVLVREACADLAAALAAMRDAHRQGRGTTDVILAGEHAAWLRGAQDVRTLFGGGGMLAPFTVGLIAPTDPLQVYAAVRHQGYWAEGFALLSRSPAPIESAANWLIDWAIDMMGSGAPRREIGALLAQSNEELRAHPAMRDDSGGTIGLDLPKPGGFGAADEERFVPGEVCSVRAGLRAAICDDASSAIVSAMVAITQDGPEVLWRGADA